MARVGWRSARCLLVVGAVLSLAGSVGAQVRPRPRGEVYWPRNFRVHSGIEKTRQLARRGPAVLHAVLTDAWRVPLTASESRELETLIRDLTSDLPDVRAEALARIIALGPAAKPRMFAATVSADAELRRAARRVLDVPAPQLPADENWPVYFFAIEDEASLDMLAQLTHHLLAGPLPDDWAAADPELPFEMHERRRGELRNLCDPWGFRRADFAGLREFDGGPRTEPALRWTLGLAILRLLATGQDRYIEPFECRLSSDSPAAARLVVAACAACWSRRPTPPPLLESVARQADLSQRLRIVRALPDFTKSPDAERIGATLRPWLDELPPAAAFELAGQLWVQREDEAALARLIRAIPSDRAALEWLARRRTERPAPRSLLHALQPFLKSADVAERCAGLRTLGCFTGEEAVVRLVAALGDVDPAVIVEAARQLSHNRTEPALLERLLLEAREHPDHDVRIALGSEVGIPIPAEPLDPFSQDLAQPEEPEFFESEEWNPPAFAPPASDLPGAQEVRTGTPPDPE